jgi:intergrase/recombinase
MTLGMCKLGLKPARNITVRHQRHAFCASPTSIRRLQSKVVTRLLEAGEPDHVVESITGHLSRRLLEHYSHLRLNAKKAALDRLDGSTKGTSIKRAK